MKLQTHTFTHELKPPIFNKWTENKRALMWGSALPASILVFLTVNKWAGLQLAAHYRGAVVTHGRVPRRALWFGVTVDARDCGERETAQQRWVRREVALLVVRSHQTERGHPGGWGVGIWGIFRKRSLWMEQLGLSSQITLVVNEYNSLYFSSTWRWKTEG